MMGFAAAQPILRAENVQEAIEDCRDVGDPVPTDDDSLFRHARA
jgi:hypothetical protein